MGSQTRKITLDTAVLFAGRAAGLLLSIVRLNYLALALGLVNFGVLNFATYFVSLFQAFFDLGLSPILTREIARDPGQSRAVLGRTLILKVIVAGLAGGLVGTLSFVSRFDAVTNWAILLTTFATAVSSVAMAFLSAFQAHRRMVIVSATTIVTDLLLSIAIIGLIPRWPSVMTALIITASLAVLNLGVLTVLYARLIGFPVLRPDSAFTRRMLGEGMPVAVSALGISLYTFLGPTILKYTRTEAEVGIYSAAYKIISILTLVPTTFLQVVYPLFAEFHASAPQKLGKALRDSIRVMTEISVPLSVGGVILAPRIIAFLYPESFAPASVVLQLMIPGVSVGYLAYIMTSFLLAHNRQVYCMWTSLSVALTVTVAHAFLTPRYGPVAAAAISSATEILLFAHMMVFTRRAGYPLVPSPRLLKVLFAAAAMGLLLLLLDGLPLVPLMVLGGLGYAGLLLALGGFGEQEREILAKTVNRILGE